VSALKGEYQHFMLKEIMEQPEALSDTIWSLGTLDPAELYLEDLGPASEKLAGVERVVLIGMGTSLHAAMIGRHYMEQFGGVPAETDNASEFRYRDPVLGPGTLVISVSQSGETVDILEAMSVAKAKGALQVRSATPRAPRRREWRTASSIRAPASNVVSQVPSASPQRWSRSTRRA